MRNCQEQSHMKRVSIKNNNNKNKVSVKYQYIGQHEYGEISTASCIKKKPNQTTFEITQGTYTLYTKYSMMKKNKKTKLASILEAACTFLLYEVMHQIR